MTIDLTDDEFAALLEMAYLGEWMANSHLASDDDKNSEYEAVLGKLLGLAREVGLDELVEEDGGKLGPSAAFEESEAMRSVIEDYDNDTFWQEIVDRLATRDLLQRYGERRLDAMSPEERLNLLDEAADRYAKEMEEYGLDRLIVAEEPVT
ncbi:MAG: hypothetical protein SF066_21245 [Thermoanaerobaculia bacterium]|nr:hypothetical protein [Thermoanaerobaculia bacterium]